MTRICISHYYTHCCFTWCNVAEWLWNCCQLDRWLLLITFSRQWKCCLLSWPCGYGTEMKWHWLWRYVMPKTSRAFFGLHAWCGFVRATRPVQIQPIFSVCEHWCMNLALSTSKMCRSSAWNSGCLPRTHVGHPWDESGRPPFSMSYPTNQSPRSCNSRNGTRSWSPPR